MEANKTTRLIKEYAAIFLNRGVTSRAAIATQNAPLNSRPGWVSKTRKFPAGSCSKNGKDKPSSFPANKKAYSVFKQENRNRLTRSIFEKNTICSRTRNRRRAIRSCLAVQPFCAIHVNSIGTMSTRSSAPPGTRSG